MFKDLRSWWPLKLGMGRYTYLPIRYYHDTWVPIRYVLQLFIFFKNFVSTSIAFRYCYVLRVFVFNSKPWEKVERYT